MGSYVVHEPYLPPRTFTSLGKAKAKLAARSERSSDGCLLWTGGKFADGYGGIWHGGKMCKVHRIAYEMAYGSFDDTLFVCHRCDVRHCIEPTHLFLGTHGDNMADRQSKSRVARGTRQGSAKLTEDDVRTIRQLYSDGWLQREIGERFNIHQVHVGDIVDRTRWGWLQ